MTGSPDPQGWVSFSFVGVRAWAPVPEEQVWMQEATWRTGERKRQADARHQQCFLEDEKHLPFQHGLQLRETEDFAAIMLRAQSRFWPEDLAMV